MGSVVVMDSGVIAIDRKAENVGAIKTTEPETPAAEEIAMKRFRRSSHRNSAVAIFGGI